MNRVVPIAMGNGQSFGNSLTRGTQTRLERSIASISMQALSSLSRVSANDSPACFVDEDAETRFTYMSSSFNNIHSLTSDYALNKKFDVAISYARPSIADIEMAHEIAGKLEQSGLSVWINTKRFENGKAQSSFRDVVSSSPIVVVCLTESYEISPHCIDEMKQAVAQRCPMVIASIMRGSAKTLSILRSSSMVLVVDFPQAVVNKSVQRLVSKVLDLRSSLCRSHSSGPVPVDPPAKYSVLSYDQVATGAQLRHANEYYVSLGGIATTREGSLIVADWLNKRIKRVQVTEPPSAICVQPTSRDGDSLTIQSQSETLFEDLSATEFGALCCLDYLPLRLFPTEKVSLVALVSGSKYLSIVDLDKRATVLKVVVDKCSPPCAGSMVAELNYGHVLVGFVGRKQLHVIDFRHAVSGIQSEVSQCALGSELRCVSYNQQLNRLACATASGSGVTNIVLSNCLTDLSKLSSLLQITSSELSVSGVVDQMYLTDNCSIILHRSASRSPPTICADSGALEVLSPNGTSLFMCEDSMPARILCASVSTTDCQQDASQSTIVIHFWSEDLVLRRIGLLQAHQ